MQLVLKTHGDELSAFLSGELDEHSASHVRKKLDEAISDGKIKRIVFDLKDVSFMDSSGIGVILGRCKKLMDRGGGMNVVNAQRSVEKVLRMSGVYKLCTERSGK